MTPQKLWGLKAHIPIEVLGRPKPSSVNHFQNLRQYFDIYRNTDNQKTEKRKKTQTKKQKERNKQPSNQTDSIFKKQKNKRRGGGLRCTSPLLS